MAHIPEDSISDILFRLSWRSICNLKFTSMHFYALLNSFARSPCFLTSNEEEAELLGGLFYQKSSARFRLGLGRPKSGKDTKVWFTTMTRFGSQAEQVEQELIERGLVAVAAEERMSLLPINFRVDACRHGLLLCSLSPDVSCVQDQKQYPILWEVRNRYYVCNPITKKFTWLPMPPQLFDETASFLVDEESGHDQVIQVPVTYAQDTNHKKGIVAIVDLYSSVSRTWRTEHFKFHLLMTMTITVTITIAPWN